LLRFEAQAVSAYWTYRRHEGAAQVCEGTARAIRALSEFTKAQLESARA
jgi:hypothetical protein